MHWLWRLSTLDRAQLSSHLSCSLSCCLSTFEAVARTLVRQSVAIHFSNGLDMTLCVLCTVRLVSLCVILPRAINS